MMQINGKENKRAETRRSRKTRRNKIKNERTPAKASINECGKYTNKKKTTVNKKEKNDRRQKRIQIEYLQTNINKLQMERKEPKQKGNIKIKEVGTRELRR